jgi:hypothetical protein
MVRQNVQEARMSMNYQYGNLLFLWVLVKIKEKTENANNIFGVGTILGGLVGYSKQLFWFSLVCEQQLYILTSAPVTSEFVGSIPGQTHSSCDRVGDSLGQRRFPPGAPVSCYIHYKSPNIVYRANNVLVDAQLSIQYFNNF